MLQDWLAMLKTTLICLIVTAASWGQTPTITTYAGNGSPGYSGDGGPATLAQLTYPNNIAIASNGDVYFNDYGVLGAPIRRIDAVTGVIDRVVGGGSIPYPNDGALATDIALGGYGVVAVDGVGNLFFTDLDPAGNGELIRRVDSVTGRVSTIAGGGAPIIVRTRGSHPIGEPFFDVGTWSGDGGPATSAFLLSVNDMCCDPSGHLWFVDFCIVRRIDVFSGIITRVAGNGVVDNGFPPEAAGWELRGIHSNDGMPGLQTGFAWLHAIALDGAGNVYVSETGSFATPRGCVRKIDATTTIVSTIAGQSEGTGYTGDGGLATAAKLAWPVGLALDGQRNLFVADYDKFVVRRVDALTGIITTVAGDGNPGSGGDGGPALLASFAGPWDIAFDSQGSLYVVDSDGSRIRKVTGLVPMPPTAVAGPDQSIHASGIVNLDGSSSFDDDTTSAALLYFWTMVERPAGSNAVITNAGTINASFVADQPGTYVVELVVEDAMGLRSPPDRVLVSSTNLAPTADAGNDAGGIVNQVVGLNGSQSSDPENDPLTWFWAISSKPSGSVAGLMNALTATPSFVPDLAGTYVIGLVVDDGFGPSTVDFVSIVVISAQEYAQVTTMAAMVTVSELPASGVSSTGNQQALVNFLSQAVQSLQGGNDASARHKLQMALIRTDGWTLRGSADAGGQGRDWVTERDAAQAVYAQIIAALGALP